MFSVLLITVLSCFSFCLQYFLVSSKVPLLLLRLLLILYQKFYLMENTQILFVQQCLALDPDFTWKIYILVQFIRRQRRYILAANLSKSYWAWFSTILSSIILIWSVTVIFIRIKKIFLKILEDRLLVTQYQLLKKNTVFLCVLCKLL